MMSTEEIIQYTHAKGVEDARNSRESFHQIYRQPYRTAYENGYREGVRQNFADDIASFSKEK